MKASVTRGGSAISASRCRVTSSRLQPAGRTRSAMAPMAAIGRVRCAIASSTSSRACRLSHFDPSKPEKSKRGMVMSKFWKHPVRAVAGFIAGAVLVGAAMFTVPSEQGKAEPPNAAPPATPVSAAVVEQRDVAVWDEFSGRLDAVERVEVRSRVAGAIKAKHFREGALVKAGDPLITIDPEPYAAEVDRAKAQVLAAEARLAYAQKEQEIGRASCRE